MEHYSITEFNKRRLQRGEKYCFRADVSTDGELDGWVWLSMKDIVEIIEDEECSISGHEQFKDEISKNEIWNKIWGDE
jgi:hypothetical protein